MSTAGAFDGLGTVLLADPGLTGWSVTHFGRALTLVNGNRPVETVASQHLPALVLEMGDGQAEELVHGQQMETVQELGCALVWNEQNEADAFVQRTALPEIIARALMSNRTLSGQVAGAWLQSWSPDRGANHPRNVFVFAVAVEDFIQGA